MKILISGAEGYISYPLMVALSQTEHEILGIDNNARNEWVAKCKGRKTFPEYDYPRIRGDLSNRDFVNEILAVNRPDVIIHLASQPSMPYSQINWERALYTQTNNLSMFLNLLWGAKENELNPKIILTTTTGIPGQHYELIPEFHTFNMAGSWYHVSRGFDSANAVLASKQFGFTIAEFRTSIVHGVQTEIMQKLNLATRFDTDFYFGTALNRFVKMALDDKPITVYGKGEQTKPFISLEDTVQSLINAIDYDFQEKYTILNQTTTSVSITNLAHMITNFTKGKVAHIPNPRKEKEDFQMQFENKEFLKVLGRKPTQIEDDIKKMIDYFKEGYAEENRSFTVAD